jgi:integrase
MLRRRGKAARIHNMHAHRLRHTLSQVWRREQSNESDAMAIMGWHFPEMRIRTDGLRVLNIKVGCACSKMMQLARPTKAS